MDMTPNKDKEGSETMTSPIGSMLNRCFRNLYRKFELQAVTPDGFLFTAKSTSDGKTYNLRFHGTELFADMGSNWMRIGSIEHTHKMIGVSRR